MIIFYSAFSFVHFERDFFHFPSARQVFLFVRPIHYPMKLFISALHFLLCILQENSFICQVQEKYSFLYDLLIYPIKAFLCTLHFFGVFHFESNIFQMASEREVLTHSQNFENAIKCFVCIVVEFEIDFLHFKMDRELLLISAK